MDSSPDFLNEGTKGIGLTGKDMVTLNDLVDDFLELEDEIKVKKKETEVLEKEYNVLKATTIPNFVSKAGLSNLTLETGETINIKNEVSTTIVDELLFYKYLEDKGDDDIIKDLIVIEMPKDEEKRAFIKELKRDMLKRMIAFESKRGINKKTLDAYVKRMDEAGEEIPASIKVFRYKKTKIKRSK